MKPVFLYAMFVYYFSLVDESLTTIDPMAGFSEIFGTFEQLNLQHTWKTAHHKYHHARVHTRCGEPRPHEKVIV